MTFVGRKHVLKRFLTYKYVNHSPLTTNLQIYRHCTILNNYAENEGEDE